MAVGVCPRLPSLASFAMSFAWTAALAQSRGTPITPGSRPLTPAGPWALGAVAKVSLLRASK